MKGLLLLIAGLLSVQLLVAQPKTEVRAVWLTTNYALDWPVNKTEVGQQKELCRLLDQLQETHINTIIFQVQCRSDVLWSSDYQPWSRYITGTPGKDPGYDVLQFVIDECHARNMEMHAWIVPFPLGSDATVGHYKRNHVKNKRPELCVKYGSEWYLDPGLPETTEYLLGLYTELIEKYDFDGVNLDYTRYPDANFPDERSYSRYGNGMARDEWRRQNINRFVYRLYDMIQEKKPGMRLGAAPVGAYESLPDAYSGFTAHSHVFQDPVDWMGKGKLDLVFPQVYWVDYYGQQLANWIGKSYGRPVVAGLAAYKLLPPPDSEGWPLSSITSQIRQARELGAGGLCFFRTKQLTDNLKKIRDTLQTDYFKYPANLPSMDWHGAGAPGTPGHLTVTHKDGDTYTIRWEAPANAAANPVRYYCVYASASEEIDMNDVKNLVAHYIKGNSIEYTLPDPDVESYFAVTSFDRGYYESIPSDIVSTRGTTKLVEKRVGETRFARVGNQLIINSGEIINDLKLYSADGMLLLKGGYISQQLVLDLSMLDQGVYIAVVTLKTGKIIRHKVWK